METKWFKVKDARPPEKKLLMVTGPSGYIYNTQFLELAYINTNYRPTLADGKLRWLDVCNDELSDRGFYPTHWAEPIKLPGLDFEVR